MTLPEVLLWDRIRCRRLHGIHFRRQHPAGPYILDFYCSHLRLAIEVDGATHEHPKQVLHDAQRDRWLADNGNRVLRFAASEILDDDAIDAVLFSIADAAAPSTAFGGFPPPLKRGRNLESRP